MDGNDKIQDLQKAHMEIQKVLKNLDDIETKTIMDCAMDSSYLKSPEKWNLESSDDDSLIILSDKDVAMQNLESAYSQNKDETLKEEVVAARAIIEEQRAKIEELQHQEADLAKELCDVQGVAIEQKAEIEAFQEKLFEIISIVSVGAKNLSAKFEDTQGKDLSLRHPENESQQSLSSRRFGWIYSYNTFLILFLFALTGLVGYSGLVLLQHEAKFKHLDVKMAECQSQNVLYLDKISELISEIRRANGTIAKLEAQNKNNKAKFQDALKTIAKLKSKNKAYEENIATFEAQMEQCMVQYPKSQNFVNALLELVRLGTIWTNVFGKTSTESKLHDEL